MNKRAKLLSLVAFSLAGGGFAAGSAAMAAAIPSVLTAEVVRPPQAAAVLLTQAASAPVASAPATGSSPPTPANAKIAPASTSSSDASIPPAGALPPVSTQPLPVKPPQATVTVPMLPPEKPAIGIKEKEKNVPAMFLFASKKLPSRGKPTVYGYYSRGCLQGAVELPIDGAHWEVMRLSRNRNWGHPELIGFLKGFSAEVAKVTSRHGILIGDMAQPRGGPLPFGHVSHQVGLDVDIWYTPMPDRILTREERETLSATGMVAADGLHVSKNWTPADAAFIRLAAEQPEVERVLVNAAVKKQLCEMEGKHRYAWMDKVRPWYGHKTHIHVRLKCPAGSPQCRHQPPVPGSNQCGAKELAYWFSNGVLHPKPPAHPKPRKEITLADMPVACKSVLNAPAKEIDLAGERR